MQRFEIEDSFDNKAEQSIKDRKRNMPIKESIKSS
jgi:hypothetical protein